MKNTVVISIFLLLLLSSCTNDEALFFENALCIQHVNTIDAAEGLQTNRTVIIQGNKIIADVAADSLNLSEKNTIVEGSGKYLIPGLWDAHVHFAYIEELAPSMFKLFLAHGITSVRDTGGEIHFLKKWKDKAEANPEDAPRVMIAGPLLDGIPNVYDGSIPARPPLSVGIPTVEGATQQVNFLDSVGVDLLKAYEMLAPEQFLAIMNRARALNLKVTGHVPLSMDVITASNAGLNSMEHLRNLEMSTAANAEELLQQRRAFLESGKNDVGGVLRARIHRAQRIEALNNQDEVKTQAVLAALAKNKTWQIPTLSIMTAGVSRAFGRPEWQASFQYLPPAIETKWLDGVKNVMQQDITPERQLYADWMHEMTGKIHASEIPIMAGTDCPIFYLTPGLSLHEELVLLEKSGLTPLEILKTATLNPARYFNMENELGLIKEGMIADLLLLNANPLEDIRNTTKIEAVVKDGKMHDKTALNAMLESLD